MPNACKAGFVEELARRFGELRKMDGSGSLFVIGDEAARVYIRYSKVHPDGRTFFGLREVDLRQLEGHNSFLCFLLNDDSAPLIIPFCDFEEVFRAAETAKDGQYKVQLTQRDSLELYVARQGRFNVEGYVGFDVIDRSLKAANELRPPLDLSHSQIQTMLACVGKLKGYDVFVPASDVGRLDWTLARRFQMLEDIPSGFQQIRSVLSEIDVTWVEGGRNTIAALFEVEHSTTVYSGLLRFNDVLLTNPSVSRFTIVSSDARRGLFARQLFRPTFRKSGLSELCSFLEYRNVFDWHTRLARGARDEPMG
jgi:hypothetical protein